MTRKRVWIGLLLGILAILLWLSARLALFRIFQVDECQNLYMARVLSTGQTSTFFTNASLFLFGPLSWMTQRAVHSAALFTASRLLFLGVFWLNVLLLSLIAGKRLLSIRGLIALLAAASLVPLWDCGFEVRHDNLILTGILLTWWAVRVKPMGLPSYLLAGAVAVTLLFIAVKSFVYVFPLSFLLLVFPPPAHKTTRWRLGLAWVAGALLATVIIRVCYGTGTAWDIYFSVFRGVAKYSANNHGGDGRFWPWDTLRRLLWQTPLLLSLTAAAGVTVAASLARRRKAALTWDGNLPEVLLLLVALAALLANPTPFPYNLVNVVPYAFLLAFNYGAGVWNEIRERASLWPLLGTLLVVAHVAPFGVAIRQHWDRTNFRQKTLMRLAEDLTDPALDPVYDSIGMVPTRRSIGFQWYLHSLNIRSFINGDYPTVREMLATNPAAVFIPSYRTDWLPAEDHAYIRQRYVPLSDDFWVLGTMLPTGGGSFEIVHPGRYRIASRQDSDIAGVSPANTEGARTREADGLVVGTLDGVAIPPRPVELSVGTHHIDTERDCRPTVVWVGPVVGRVGRLSDGDHQTLFRKWD